MIVASRSVLAGPRMGQHARDGRSMVLPFVLLIGPYRAGLLSGGALIGVEHSLMLPFMFVVMLRRNDEYAPVHHRYPSGPEGGATGARRWRR